MVCYKILTEKENDLDTNNKIEIPIYQVDAFASEVFEGNPAAVCPLDQWLTDDVLQKIAEENNLSETAFFVAQENSISLRWFTPKAEVDFCGHATLAAAHVLFTKLNYPKQTIIFNTKSGEFRAEKIGFCYSLSFPAAPILPIDPPEQLLAGLGVMPKEVLAGFDYVAVLESESEIQSINPDFFKLSQLDLRGVVVTAPGTNVDFVSRCFFPNFGVNEDPVTGSAHCELAPYWAEKLRKNSLKARQLSQRTGVVECELMEERVVLKGPAVDYLQGKITIKGI